MFILNYLSIPGTITPQRCDAHPRKVSDKVDNKSVVALVLSFASLAVQTQAMLSELLGEGAAKDGLIELHRSKGRINSADQCKSAL